MQAALVGDAEFFIEACLIANVVASPNVLAFDLHRGLTATLSVGVRFERLCRNAIQRSHFVWKAFRRFWQLLRLH